MTLGRIRSYVEPMTKLLEVDVLAYAPSIHPCSAYPADSTLFVVTHAVIGCDVTQQLGPMVTFLHRLV